ncbi:MAG: hypothetical protein SVP52_01060, partial [Chloroflexota bacterium]|nr:hypothetical protein [Chloroflexota bacterium]
MEKRWAYYPPFMDCMIINGRPKASPPYHKASACGTGYPALWRNAGGFIFDYETTGMKPYAPGHKISTISLCYSPEVAYS